MVTILFIALSAAQNNLEADWAEAGGGPILRRCPICLCDSIIGHGRRRKQAHDEDHDWIQIRRGLCSQCGKTFTFLPPFSPPYCHYSLIARSQALRRFFGMLWLGSVGADGEGPRPTGHPPPMVSKSGFLSAIVLILAPHDASGKGGAGCRPTSLRWWPAVELAELISLSRSVLALTALRKLSRPPSSPGIAAILLLRLTVEGKTAPWVRI